MASVHVAWERWIAGGNSHLTLSGGHCVGLWISSLNGAGVQICEPSLSCRRWLEVDGRRGLFKILAAIVN